MVPDEVCSLNLNPNGNPVFARGDAFGRPLPARTARRIEAAFAAGPGPGLLHLGASEAAGELGPTIGWWRDLAKLFITRLCGVLDLDEALNAGLELPLGLDEAAGILASAPPMLGIEYLTEAVLRRAWDSIGVAFTAEVRASGGAAEEFLRARNPLWSAVGRIFLHLAENKARPDRPFAFLASYTSRLSDRGKLQHVPLGKAVTERATAGDRRALLSLLGPVKRAAEEAGFLRELVDSGRIFQPQAWTPAEAHRFLGELGAYEKHGLFVRFPDWWNPRQPPRVRVGVQVGRGRPAALGADALLDFSVGLSLDGEPISEAEWRAALAGSGGLALVKGRWVEVDRERIEELLRRWKAVEKRAGREGVSFLEGMRLISRLPLGEAGDATEKASGSDPDSRWLAVDAGEWLRQVLDELRNPAGAGDIEPGEGLTGALRPYQADGVHWLWLLHRLRLGGCLADDMGLGKTVQVLALLALLKRRGPESGERRPSLLVIPASLIGNWKAECARFAPELRLHVVHPSEPERPDGGRPARIEETDLVITTYGMLSRQPRLLEMEWNLAVLDEAQAIKNPGARQTRAAKSLRCLRRLALTGTPVENRLEDLWSLFDFLQPGLLGTLKQFSRLVNGGGESAGEVYARVRGLVRPYLLRRLKTDRRIIADLPEKQEVKVYCGLRKLQAALYQKAVDDLARTIRDAEGIRRRGIILAFLMRFKQICNHPSQWTGDGAWDPEASGKGMRLLDLAREIASRQEKVLVFTQFREMTGPLADLLERAFGRRGLALDGSTAVRERRRLVEEFQREDGPPFFVLSLKAGGTGLNLTAATHVIHFDRWWNPAVENQATDRAFRIGQKRNVLVHKFICQGTVEERIDEMLESKQGMADELLRDGAEAVLTRMDDRELIRFVSLERNRILSEKE